ncbi:MAG: hypothetical protein A3K50_03675 [Planctomycetes bacterium RIFOXYD12_FULL_42_12]|nr:MAG: hypothetical protein A3K50_03675 [Planctomycetes bacterium RIFOXYD12_FULL_42_12]
MFNKFRGDKGILKPGLDMLESRINKPVVGVIPYIHNLGVDDEDSVSLEYIGSKYTRFRDAEELRLNPKTLSNLQPSAFSLQPVIDIVVIKLPRISNFTDFNTLTHEKDVRVRFVDKVENIGKPDLLIIPGTKNTIGDLTFIKERGIFGEIIELSRQGTMTIGICGGYQMLGKQINDPHHVES